MWGILVDLFDRKDHLVHMNSDVTTQSIYFARFYFIDPNIRLRFDIALYTRAVFLLGLLYVGSYYMGEIISCVRFHTAFFQKSLHKKWNTFLIKCFALLLKLSIFVLHFCFFEIKYEIMLAPRSPYL